MKKFISLLLCMMLVLCSCGAKTEVPSTDLEKPHGPKVDAYGTYSFYTPENTDYAYIAEFADFIGQGVNPGLYIINGLSAADDFTITDAATIYSVKDADTEDNYMTISIKHAPAETDRMDTTYFTVENYYNGQKRSTVEDFGNTLLDSSIGLIDTPKGALKACYIEFENKLTSCDSIRFYMCNDSIDENYFGIMITADVPLDNQEKVIAVRNCLGSLTFLA